MTHIHTQGRKEGIQKILNTCDRSVTENPKLGSLCTKYIRMLHVYSWLKVSKKTEGRSGRGFFPALFLCLLFLPAFSIYIYTYVMRMRRMAMAMAMAMAMMMWR